MPTAYILINSILGKEEEIIKQISQIRQVKEVQVLYGVHDIFVKIQTESVDEMNNAITSNIRKINGDNFYCYTCFYSRTRWERIKPKLFFKMKKY